MKLNKKDIARFWSRVKVGNDNSCWYWDNPTHLFGYGWFRVNGRNHLSHRIAKIIWDDGLEMDNKFVLHNCNNPACCNPYHLRWGTQKENIEDSIKAGTKTDPPRNRNKPPVMKGEDNHISKMTNKSVKSLRRDRSKGISYKKLSEKYQISVSTVAQIVNFKTWKNI